MFDSAGALMGRLDRGARRRRHMKGEAWILIGVLSGARELSIGNPFSNSEARADPRFRFVNVSAYRYARASADVAAPTITDSTASCDRKGQISRDRVLVSCDCDVIKGEHKHRKGSEQLEAVCLQ